MTSEEIYLLVTTLLPDWVMLLCYGLAAARGFLIWRRGGYLITPSLAMASVVFPLAAITVYYAWVTFLGPLPLPRLAGGRTVFFGLGLGIHTLFYFMNHGKNDT